MDTVAEVSTYVIDREPSHIPEPREDEFEGGLVGDSPDLALSNLQRDRLMVIDLKSDMVVSPWLTAGVIFLGFSLMLHTALLCARCCIDFVVHVWLKCYNYFSMYATEILHQLTCVFLQCWVN
jgi:hypothetical protein